MELGAGVTSRLDAQRSLRLLGGAYLLFAAVWPFLLPDDQPLNLIVLLGILVGGPGLLLLGASYWLPRTALHPGSYSTILRWVLGAIGAVLGVLLLVTVVSELRSPVQNVLILTALGSVAGLGIGYQNAKAHTRALHAEQRRREAEQYSRELERYETIVETVNDGIFVVDESDEFMLVNEGYAEMVGYDRETLLGSHGSLVLGDDADSLSAEIDRDEREDALQAKTYEVEVETASGEVIDTESTIAPLPGRPTDEHDYVGVVRDVTERNERERELERANERLKVSNERLEQFAYAASHDLQEPLRMVSSYLTLIRRRGEAELTEETEEYLEYAVDGADRMRSMIDGLLAYSRVETQGQSMSPVDLDEVKADVLADLEARITESGATVTSEELPSVSGDADQLRQVLQNLLSNALTYSGDEPPEIHLSADRNGSQWEVSVADAGIGVDPAEQTQIFEIFQRLHTNEEYEGSGIGLALCERIVERHGGDIWVESTPGEGATFTFTLPVAEGTSDA